MSGFGTITTPKTPYPKFVMPKFIIINVPKFWYAEIFDWYGMVVVHYRNIPYLFFSILKKKLHTNLVFFPPKIINKVLDDFDGLCHTPPRD